MVSLDRWTVCLKCGPQVGRGLRSSVMAGSAYFRPGAKSGRWPDGKVSSLECDLAHGIIYRLMAAFSAAQKLAE
jgi:hypothetical protein